MEHKVEEGKKALEGLDAERKVINAMIDAALNTPSVIPTIQFRSRARTRGKSLLTDKTTPEDDLKAAAVREEIGRDALGPESTSLA